MIAGAERVDLNGTPVSVVTPDEEQYAKLRMEKQRRQQARIQSDMV
jgi:sRNA-binding protein